ncbi:MAG: hypothetical protein WD824_26910 [Cyclobacteriaceae bacterium]
MNTKGLFCFFAFAALLTISCQQENEEKELHANNPPAPGFDLANSDPAAVELADSIMAAMGGRKNWDQTRFISWNFGRRELVWDKTEGNVRIESIPDSTTYLVNINSLKGRVRIKEQELTEPDSLQKMLERAKSIWINDSYWLLMPFKLKDTGVTLKYLGEDTIAAGLNCNVLELTFKNVGDTPENKYRVYVDLHDNLVKQWAYYKVATQDSASQIRPWDNYKRYGDILLSADRSDNRGPRNVRVDEKLSAEVFTEF